MCIYLFLPVFAWCALGLNLTSRPVLVVRKFSNVQIPDFSFFPLLDSRYLTFNDWWDFRAISHSKFLQPVLNQDKSWTKASHEPRPVLHQDQSWTRTSLEPRPVLNQFKWGNLSLWMDLGLNGPLHTLALNFIWKKERFEVAHRQFSIYI